MILTHFADLQILLKPIYKYGSFLENWAQILCGFSTWSPSTFFSSCCGGENSSNVMTMMKGFFIRSSPTIKLICIKPVLLEFSASQSCFCFMQFGSRGSCTSISLLSQSLHVDCPLSAGSWAKTMDGLMHGWMNEKLATLIFISKF